MQGEKAARDQEECFLEGQLAIGFEHIVVVRYGDRGQRQQSHA